MPMSFKSKKTSKKKESQEISWILEGIVAFLRSPTWTVPIMNFVEEHCGSKSLCSINLILVCIGGKHYFLQTQGQYWNNTPVVHTGGHK